MGGPSAAAILDETAVPAVAGGGSAEAREISRAHRHPTSFHAPQTQTRGAGAGAWPTTHWPHVLGRVDGSGTLPAHMVKARRAVADAHLGRAGGASPTRRKLCSPSAARAGCGAPVQKPCGMVWADFAICSAGCIAVPIYSNLHPREDCPPRQREHAWAPGRQQGRRTDHDHVRDVDPVDSRGSEGAGGPQAERAVADHVRRDCPQVSGSGAMPSWALTTTWISSRRPMRRRRPGS